MARSVDRLICLFPFEPKAFDGTGLRVDFLGHPLVGTARQVLAAPPAPLPWKGDPQVAVLPGSRAHEIRRILPVMWQAAGLLQKRYPSASFLLAAPDAATASRPARDSGTLP